MINEFIVYFQIYHGNTKKIGWVYVKITVWLVWQVRNVKRSMHINFKRSAKLQVHKCRCNLLMCGASTWLIAGMIKETQRKEGMVESYWKFNLKLYEFSNYIAIKLKISSIKLAKIWLSWICLFFSSKEKFASLEKPVFTYFSFFKINI